MHHSHYERLTTLPLDLVVRHIGLPPNRPTIEIMGHELKLFSLRMRTFKQSGTTCTGCGVNASFFAVERARADGSTKYHLNMYGVVNGREEMFTCDHVIARSKGGVNNLSNTQTMCITCNQKKGDKPDVKIHVQPRVEYIYSH